MCTSREVCTGIEVCSQALTGVYPSVHKCIHMGVYKNRRSAQAPTGEHTQVSAPAWPQGCEHKHTVPCTTVYTHTQSTQRGGLSREPLWGMHPHVHVHTRAHAHTPNPQASGHGNSDRRVCVCLMRIPRQGLTPASFRLPKGSMAPPVRAQLRKPHPHKPHPLCQLHTHSRD